MAYSVSEPHPDFGKDPNILNELGHTRYPRYVEHESKRVIVQNEQEEFDLTGKVEFPITNKFKKKAADWGDKK